jgi:hypothetical protein
MTPEEQAIEKAYLSHIEALFRTMISCLGAGADAQDSLKRFDAGCELARRAKLLTQQREPPK